MTLTTEAASRKPVSQNGLAALREQYGCGPVKFAETEDGLYERNLLSLYAGEAPRDVPVDQRQRKT